MEGYHIRHMGSPSKSSSKPRRKNLLAYFTRNLMTVVGVVFIWRGVWYLLDIVDSRFFGGDHLFTAIGGIVGGLLILYLPDKDLSEIEKL
jgi:hypothetical protein